MAQCVKEVKSVPKSAIDGLATDWVRARAYANLDTALGRKRTEISPRSWSELSTLLFGRVRSIGSLNVTDYAKIERMAGPYGVVFFKILLAQKQVEP